MIKNEFNLVMVTVASVLMWYAMDDISFLQFVSTIGLMWELGG